MQMLNLFIVVKKYFENWFNALLLSRFQLPLTPHQGNFTIEYRIHVTTENQGKNLLWDEVRGRD